MRGIDHLPAVDDASDLVHLELAAVAPRSRRLAPERGVALHQRKAEVPSRRCVAPARALGRELEHACVARLRREQFEAKIQGILARGCRRELIHEALDHEAVGRVADGAHVADVDADLLARIGEREIRHAVGIVVRIFDDGIERVGDGRRRRTRRDRGTGDMQLPSDQFAVGVESAADSFACRRPVGVMRHVVFAGPDQFHREPDGFRCLDRRRNEIDIQAATESAADEEWYGR